MWKSSYFTVMILLTLIAAAAAVAFQVFEMQEYGLPLIPQL